MPDKLTLKKPQTISIKLEYPLEWPGENGKEMISEIEFRRPKGRDIKDLGKDVSMDDIIKIAVKINTKGFTPHFFDGLDGVDYLNVTEVIGDFLDSGAQTGKSNYHS